MQNEVSEAVVETVARAMLADELARTAPRRDFDVEWEVEGPAWLANATAAITALRQAATPPPDLQVERLREALDEIRTKVSAAGYDPEQTLSEIDDVARAALSQEGK